MLMAGDAAGFVDPFVGDGISLALRGGSLAAQCLLPFFAGEIGLKEATGRYCEAYGRQLAHVFRISSKLRRMLVLPRMVRTPVVSLLAKSPRITRYLVKKTR